MAYAEEDIIRLGIVMLDTLGSEIVNVHHVRLNSLVIGSDEAVAASLQDWVETLYSYINEDINAGVLSDRIEVFNITQNAPGAVLSWTLSASNATGTALPSGVCPLVIARTGISRKVGRKFLPPYTSANLAAGRWGSGTLSRMDDYGLHWQEPFVTTNLNVIQGGVYGGTVPTFSTIIQARGNPIPAYQRRRREGVGS